MQKPRAKYSYFVHTAEDGQKTLVLTDEGTGPIMSLTNDIENVVEQACLEQDLKTPHVRVVYRDSDGTWDGWNTKTHQFIPLVQDRAEDAINHLDLYFKSQYDELSTP